MLGWFGMGASEEGLFNVAAWHGEGDMPFSWGV
jgi:hypothetical protein